jgi:hypothetical protein
MLILGGLFLWAGPPLALVGGVGMLVTCVL